MQFKFIGKNQFIKSMQQARAEYLLTHNKDQVEALKDVIR